MDSPPTPPTPPVAISTNADRVRSGSSCGAANSTNSAGSGCGIATVTAESTNGINKRRSGVNGCISTGTTSATDA
jgi:hypothetical protein